MEGSKISENNLYKNKKTNSKYWPSSNLNIDKLNGTELTKSSTLQQNHHHQPISLESSIIDYNSSSWHIPRPSLVSRSDKDSENDSNYSDNNQLNHNNSNFPQRSFHSSQNSTNSTHSAASGTLLLTAANLANLAKSHPPVITSSKSIDDNDSVASSMHFTVVNGLGRPVVYKKSWCARHQLTVLVCTMSLLFMIGLLAGILYMEMRIHGRYN